jgi:hypothetical protein
MSNHKLDYMILSHTSYPQLTNPEPGSMISINRISAALSASVAQLAEQLIRNQQITGSNPVAGSIKSST